MYMIRKIIYMIRERKIRERMDKRIRHYLNTDNGKKLAVRSLCLAARLSGIEIPLSRLCTCSVPMNKTYTSISTNGIWTRFKWNPPRGTQLSLPTMAVPGPIDLESFINYLEDMQV